jgi:acyl-CoA synthetase (AMP-forming)/AMP-acid ligase II
LIFKLPHRFGASQQRASASTPQKEDPAMSRQPDVSSQLVLGELLLRWVRKQPEKLALRYNSRNYTYAMFNERVNRLANGLSDLGIAKGDKVSLLLLNCNEILECYFALAKLGAVAVPLNFRLAGPELSYQINQSDSRALILGEAFLSVIQGIRGELSQVRHFILAGTAKEADMLDYEALLVGGAHAEPCVYVEDDDPLFIMYTSGTTGKPKGAVLTHKSVLMDSVNIAQEIGLGNDERYLCVPPLFHMAAAAVTITMIYVGATTTICDNFVPQEIPKMIQEEGITLLFLVPAMWIFLLQVPGLQDFELGSVRIGVTGAAVMPTEVKNQIMSRFPNAGIYDIFGQTEMSPCTTMLKAEDALRKPGSVGRRIINVEARVVDSDDNDVPIGEIGEIVYRGPTVMKEYYRNPEATEEVMAGGWFHSGDLVREDEEGYIYVVDRKKDMIISGGENIYAAEVEEVLFAHPKILEAAVIGVEDPEWGEAVKALVVAKEGETLDEQEVTEHCKSRLAGYKKPKTVEFLESLPRNAAGKVMKFQLREKYK